jgi:hypothetical protein
MVDKVALGQVFPEYFSFTSSISFHRCSITRKKTEKLTSSSQGCTISLQGCGVSVASAAGPFTTKRSANTI